MRRRELLKLFGIGTSVVPLLSGIPEMQAESKLIEVPKLELIDGPMPKPSSLAADLERLFVERQVVSVCITPRQGEPFTFRAHQAVIDTMRTHLVDVTSRYSGFREFMPSSSACDITLTVRCLSRPTIG